MTPVERSEVTLWELPNTDDTYALSFAPHLQGDIVVICNSVTKLSVTSKFTPGGSVSVGVSGVADSLLWGLTVLEAAKWARGNSREGESAAYPRFSFTFLRP